MFRTRTKANEGDKEMREIKFRAWDKKKKEMLDSSIIICLNGTLFCATPTKCILNYNLTPIKDFILMQYTGLKDRKGKEVFEGDICKDPEFSDIVQVKFGCDYGKEYGNDYVDAGFGLQGIHPYSNGRVKWSKDRLNTRYAENLEIIGNIYENPELLEAKK